MMRIYFLIPS